MYFGIPPNCVNEMTFNLFSLGSWEILSGLLLNTSQSWYCLYSELQIKGNTRSVLGSSWRQLKERNVLGKQQWLWWSKGTDKAMSVRRRQYFWKCSFVAENPHTFSNYSSQFNQVVVSTYPRLFLPYPLPTNLPIPSGIPGAPGQVG